MYNSLFRGHHLAAHHRSGGSRTGTGIYAAGAGQAGQVRAIGYGGATPTNAVGVADHHHTFEAPSYSSSYTIGRQADSDVNFAHVQDPLSNNDAVGFGSHFGLAQCIAKSTPHEVWHGNYVDMFRLVLDALAQPYLHLYIAVDFEFAAGAATDVHHRPRITTTCYDYLQRYVNQGDVVQMGIVLAFLGDVQHTPLLPVIALEINFDFNADEPKYNSESIEYLLNQGHALKEHGNKGVMPACVYEGLLRHLPCGDDSVTWITFHGDYDFGFLLRLLQGRGRGDRSHGHLPPALPTFLHQLRDKFPVLYDVRVLGQLVDDGFSGSLIALVDLLEVLPSGKEHHAGSDALLTLLCFFKIVELSGHQLHRLDARQGLLAGLEEWNMPIKCALHVDEDDCNIMIIEVQQNNLKQEAQRIEELLASNFNIIGVEVIHPRLGMRSYAVDAQQNYELMTSCFKDANSTEIFITFMNSEGMLAYGRVWKFSISSMPGNGYLHPRQFTRLMASCGATNNPAVSWVTFHGFDRIASIIKSFRAPEELPSDWRSYVNHRMAYFPDMYDVALIVNRCSDIGKLPTGCRGGLFDVARALKLNLIEDDNPVTRVLLTLRCYMRLVERDDFLCIASAVQGQLMENCCWRCPANRSRMEDA